MLDLDARGALLLLVWVLLNLLLNFFNKWALSPMVIELSWGGSLIHESLRGPSNGAGFSFPLFYSMCHMAASFVGASTKSDGPWLRSCCVLTRLVEGWQRKMRLAPTNEAAMWHIE